MATILLILISITAAYLLYNVITSQQIAAKQAAGPAAQPPLISIEGISVTNYSITVFVRSENTPATIEQAYLYDINNTLAARMFTLYPHTIPPGTAQPVEFYLDTEVLPGHYQVVVYTTRGTTVAKYFENPTGTGKTTVLENLTTAYTSDTNSLNTSDALAIYKAWIDAVQDRVYFNVTALVDLVYLRVALHNNSATNLVDLGLWNPYVRTSTLAASSYDSQFWQAPGLSGWGPFTVVYTVKTS